VKDHGSTTCNILTIPTNTQPHSLTFEALVKPEHWIRVITLSTGLMRMTQSSTH